jgi:hypothetical protein
MASRSKRRAKHAVVFDTYVLPIQSWNWIYSLGIYDVKWQPDEAYSEHRHLIVRGALDVPKSIAGHKVELAFIPSRDLREPMPVGRERPRAVGSFNKSRGSDVLQGLLSMSEDVLPALLPMLISERLRYVVLFGEKLKRRSALIRSYSFQSIITEDDLPPDEC